MKEYNYYVYILASKKNGVLYIGVTNSLIKRIGQHKNKEKLSFTSQYFVDKLVYYEHYTQIEDAIKREKLLKGWKREWKINLIEKDNPDWKDLYKLTN